MANKFETIDDYIGSFPTDVQPILEEVRRAIRKAAPGAVETISYQMPTFKLDGHSLVYFGGWKHHIGLYPIPAFDEEIEKELSQYRAAKDTLRFPLREPVPYELVARVVGLLIGKRLQGER
ncbi:MAG: DUF1801 domain-containing protein [Acidimicrobiia bacterium]